MVLPLLHLSNFLVMITAECDPQQNFAQCVCQMKHIEYTSLIY